MRWNPPPRAGVVEGVTVLACPPTDLAITGRTVTRRTVARRAVSLAGRPPVWLAHRVGRAGAGRRSAHRSLWHERSPHVVTHRLHLNPISTLSQRRPAVRHPWRGRLEDHRNHDPGHPRIRRRGQTSTRASAIPSATAFTRSRALIVAALLRNPPTARVSSTLASSCPAPVPIFRSTISGIPASTRCRSTRVPADYIATIGPADGLKADFGSGLWAGGPIGIPDNVVPAS